jgi:alpha-beta hydrolase superfamily lysophospholipase
MHFVRVCQQGLHIPPSVLLQSDLLVHPHLRLQSQVSLPALAHTMSLTTAEIVIANASGKKTANVLIVNATAKYVIDNVKSATEIANVHRQRPGIQSV